VKIFCENPIKGKKKKTSFSQFTKNEILITSDHLGRGTKSNIDIGKQNLWGLFRKVGTAGNNEVNYAFVNGFLSLADLTNQDWDPSTLGGIDPADASSPYTVYEVHNYKILESIPGKASKYPVWNYCRPKNLNGFISENLNLWMPQHKKI
jgi:hypothetical protein